MANSDDVMVPPGETLTLPPGCYRNVFVDHQATLILQAGGYDVRSLFLAFESKLNGAGRTVTTVDFKSSVGSEVNVTIGSVTLQTPKETTAEVISIGNHATITSALLYAPLAKIHVNSGTEVRGTEVVGKALQIEPGHYRPLDCGCILTVTLTDSDTIVVTGRELSAFARPPDGKYFLAPSVPAPATAGQQFCGPEGWVEAALKPGSPTPDTRVELEAPNVTPGTYRVVGQCSTGWFCSKDTITLPAPP
jgi:hypothetical protein